LQELSNTLLIQWGKINSPNIFVFPTTFTQVYTGYVSVTRPVNTNGTLFVVIDDVPHKNYITPQVIDSWDITSYQSNLCYILAIGF